MPTTRFHPWNPATWWTLPFGGQVGPVYPAQPRATGRIAIDARASDPGLKISVGHDRITLRGTTRGDHQPKDVFGLPAPYTYARGVSFSLDIDKAPTVDVFGATDYTAKNNRLFTLTTQRGWSALECAERLADKVNAAREYRATVVENADGSATIELARR